jgi:hypothetical protein
MRAPVRRVCKSIYGGDVDWGRRARECLVKNGLTHICDQGEGSLYAWFSEDTSELATSL